MKKQYNFKMLLEFKHNIFRINKKISRRDKKNQRDLQKLIEKRKD